MATLAQVAAGCVRKAGTCSRSQDGERVLHQVGVPGAAQAAVGDTVRVETLLGPHGREPSRRPCLPSPQPHCAPRATVVPGTHRSQTRPESASRDPRRPGPRLTARRGPGWGQERQVPAMTGGIRICQSRNKLSRPRAGPGGATGSHAWEHSGPAAPSVLPHTEDQGRHVTRDCGRTAQRGLAGCPFWLHGVGLGLGLGF